MKRLKTIITLCLVMLVLCCSCSKKEEGEKFILGLDASFPPMGFRDDDQNIVGFDIDLAKEVCKRMGVELVCQSIDWDAKEMELNTKNIDCIWNGLSYSEDRAEAMYLSKSYMTNRQVIVVLADSVINNANDLAGRTVVVQSGSTASEAMEEKVDLKASLKELVKVNDNVQAMMDLKIQGSDAVVMDEVVARYYTEKEPGTYRILEDTIADEEYVIGFRKEDQELCDKVWKELKAMKEDGTLADIATNWFGKDITNVE